MNTFIALGIACLLVSDLHLPLHEHWRLSKLTLPNLFRTFHHGEVMPRPAWSYAVGALGFGLLGLGFWRLLSGL